MTYTMNTKVSNQEKILLACNNIIYCTYQLTQLINTFNQAVAIKQDHESKEYYLSIIQDHETAIAKALNGLTPILEDIGNYLNNTDAVLPIDVRVLKAGNEIVLLGMDDVNNTYDEDNDDGQEAEKL